MVTDLKGFTGASSESSREGLIHLVKQHNQVMGPVIDLHDGKVVKAMGDGFLCAFDSATDAVNCAVMIQLIIADYNSRQKDPSRQMTLRVVINTGDVSIIGDDIIGLPVNIAARMEDLPAFANGGIGISEATFLVMNRSEVVAERLGTFEIKGVSEPIMVFSIPLERQKLKSIPGNIQQLINRAAHGDVTGEASIPLFQGGGGSSVKTPAAAAKSSQSGLAGVAQAAKTMMGNIGRKPESQSGDGVVVKEFFNEPSIALRVACFAIDMVLLLILRFAVVFLLGVSAPAGVGEWALYLVFGIPVLPAIILFGLFWRLLGASPGQLVFGLRVVHQSGFALDWETSFKRSAYFTISTCLLGLGALVYFSEEGETAFDLFAKTKVIERPKEH